MFEAVENSDIVLVALQTNQLVIVLQINFSFQLMMNAQNYYLDLYQTFSRTLSEFFIPDCPYESIKFFYCIFDVVKGKVNLENNLQRKMAVLSLEKANFEAICSKKPVSLQRKRQVLSSDRGMRLLKLVILNQF